MDQIAIQERCFRLSARYVKLSGLFPGQNIRYVYGASVFVIVCVLYATTTQVSRIVVYWSMDVLLEQLQFLSVPLGAWLKHSCYTLNYSKFKALFESILFDWRCERKEDERKIMNHYVDRAELFIKIYIGNAYFLCISFLFVPSLPFILDGISPLNESRPRVQIYEGYYFLKNQDEYYFQILFYTIVSMFSATCVFIAADTTLLYLVQHSCGLLRVAGHRIRFYLEEWVTSRDLTVKDRRRMYASVSYAIQAHARALAFLIDLDSLFRMTLFFEIGLIVITLTATLLRAASVTFSLDTYQFYAYMIAQLIHIFFLTAQGQFVINEHDSIYRKGFEMNWYTADIRTQALLILIQQRNLDPPQLTAGGLIRLDFDSFAEVVKASVSYFTVLKSV